MSKKLENRRIVLEILMEMEAGNVKLNNLLKNALEKIDYEESLARMRRLFEE